MHIHLKFLRSEKKILWFNQKVNYQNLAAGLIKNNNWYFQLSWKWFSEYHLKQFPPRLPEAYIIKEVQHNQAFFALAGLTKHKTPVGNKHSALWSGLLKTIKICIPRRHKNPFSLSEISIMKLVWLNKYFWCVLYFCSHSSSSEDRLGSSIKICIHSLYYQIHICTFTMQWWCDT